MPKKTSIGSQQNIVSVGNITGVSGNLNIDGGNITTPQTIGLTGTEIMQVFNGLYGTIVAHADLSASTKAGLKSDVEEIQEKVDRTMEKNEKLEENFLLRRFQSIARMAPDILDVAIAKFVQKAKEGTGSIE